jgi:CRISPR-associated protein Cas1
MEEKLTTAAGENQPRWDTLNQQVKAFKQFVYNPIEGYKPYELR